VEPAVKRAIEAAVDAVREQPDSAAAWGKLGMVLRVHDFRVEANRCFAQAEALDPHEPRWPYLQGRSLLLGEPDKALPYLERAAALCKDETAPLLKLAETLLAQNRLAEAEDHFRRVLQQEPDNTRAHLGLGQLTFARGQLESSLAHLQRCTASPFARQKALALLATVYRRLPGRDADAAAAGRQAEQPPPDLDFDLLDPFIAEVFELGAGKKHRLAYAYELQALGRGEEAIRVLREVVRDYPEGWTHVTLAEALLRRGDFAGAEQAARDALALAPDTVQAHFFLGVALFHQAEKRWRQPGDRSGALKQMQAATDSLRRTVARQPDHAFAHNYLGQALKYQDQPEAALTSFRQAVHCRPDFADPYLHLADLFADRGEQAAALVQLQHACRFTAANDQRPRWLLARVLGQAALWGTP
jgi:tetratricopeptide (TPR) repeat protein